MTRDVICSKVEVWNSVQHLNFAALPHPPYVYLQSISERSCLFLTKPVGLHYVLQYVLPHLKACTYHDTVTNCLNSVQCSNAYCLFRLRKKSKSTCWNDMWFEYKLVTVWKRKIKQHLSRWCPFSAPKQHTIYTVKDCSCVHIHFH